MLAVLSSGRAEEKGRIRLNFWPFFFYQTSTDRQVRELEVLGPFFYRYRSPLENGTSFRPFVSTVDRPEDCNHVYYLSPLGHHQECEDYTRSRFVPLFSHNRDKENEKNHHAFFLFFWGRSEEGEKYWGVFPFYGRLLDWNGKDETKFVLWPIRVTSRWHGNRSSTWFWPIYNRSDGPTFYQRKFWPIYGHRAKPGIYDRRFLLWPIFWYEKFNLATHPTVREMVFPLFISEKSDVHEHTTFLWPFFRYFRQHQNDTLTLDLPWPFFRYGESKKTPYRERKLWPLIGYERRENTYSHFFLWPLYKYQREEVRYKGRVYRREVRRFYLLTKFEKVWDETGKLQYEAHRVWPLGEKIKRADGFEVFYFPAIIPFHSEGIDRNYAPFLRLYEYIQDPNGFTRSKWFWGLYRHDHSDEEDFVDFAFLLQIHRKKENWQVNLLHGLLGCGKDEKGFFLKLFFLKL
ncbi:MAG: hypothetical protein GXO17_04445 [Thermodesulfobacteria bacterium]|nr:hypothetical protein [Thermodesulfobacteriota bacterium]